MVEFPNPKSCLKQVEKKHDFEAYSDNLKYNPKEKLRSTFISNFDEKVPRISKIAFHETLFSNSFSDSIKESEELFRKIDKDQNGEITFADLYNVDLNILQPFFDQLKEEKDEKEEEQKDKDEL